MGERQLLDLYHVAQAGELPERGFCHGRQASRDTKQSRRGLCLGDSLRLLNSSQVQTSQSMRDLS
jgi:hypothetical protein